MPPEQFWQPLHAGRHYAHANKDSFRDADGGKVPMKFIDYARLLGVLLSLALAHHFRPEGTDVFIALCIIIAVWQVLDWKWMSTGRRAELLAKYKARHGIPIDQPHKVDEFLKK
jgi:hypothetical protein